MAIKEVRNITSDNLTIINGIRSSASNTYKEMVPVATAENMALVASAVTTFTANQNEFVTSLINRIGLVMFKNLSYTNPLKVFKKGQLVNGETVEEIFVDLAKSYDYAWDGGDEEVNPFKREIPDIKVYFHSMNIQKVFQATTTESEISLAFTSSAGVFGLVERIIGSIFSAFEVFEWEQYKDLLLSAYTDDNFISQTVTAVTSETTAKGLVKKMRATSSKLTFPSKAYNKAGVTQVTPRKNQIVIIDSDTEAILDVDVLANAFNMNKTEFLGQLVVIDNFPVGMEKVQALVVDREWFMVYDKLMRMESIYNPAQMYWNYFLHYWALFSYSHLENAIVFETV